MIASLPAGTAQSLLADPATAAAVQATVEVPPELTAWLNDLRLLTGIPFQYLVPDARMLPMESVRFFAVDPNWIAALVDGALAVAAQNSAQASAVDTVRPLLAPGDPAAPSGLTGFLLRSTLVADWPGLRVTGYADTAGTSALSRVRLDRLAPTVLLALFEGQLARVDLAEPAQHLDLGVGSEQTRTLALRWIDGARAGTQLQPTATLPQKELEVAVALRADTARVVLDVSGTVSAVTSALAPWYSTAPMPAFGAAALAIQLSLGAHTQRFQLGGMPS